MELSMSLINTDGGTQTRAQLEQDVIDRYATEMREGAVFPPVVVFYDGTVHWLADGFHRFRAAEKVGRAVIEADVQQGTRREAVLFSLGANALHGLQRTTADKRRAVETMLKDEEWHVWSNTRIAEQCKVTEGYVRKIRNDLGIFVPSTKIVTRGGKTYQMETGRIGARTGERGGITAAGAVRGGAEGQRGEGAEEQTPVERLAGEVLAWSAQFGPHERGILQGLREYRWKHGQWNALCAGLTKPYQMRDVVAAVGVAEQRMALRRQTDKRMMGSADGMGAALGGGAEADRGGEFTEGSLRGGGGAGVARGGELMEGQCSVCGRRLTDPAHVAQGCGPVCAGRTTDDGRRTAARSFDSARQTTPGSAQDDIDAVRPSTTAPNTGASAQDAFPRRVVGAGGAARCGELTGVVEIVHGDCRAVSWGEPGGAHLVVTSPPYNVGIGYASHEDALPEAEYWALLGAVAERCYGALCEGGRACFVVPRGVGRNPWTPFAPRVAEVLAAAGLALRGSIIWAKSTTGNRTSWGSFRLPSDPSLRDTTEEIVIAHKGGSRLELPPGVVLHDEKGAHTGWLADANEFMALAQDHWSVAPESASHIGHPAPFPVALAERLIRFYGYPGCHVVDPFAGSGTVGVAALRLRCRATLIELDEGYCGLAAKRCEAEAADGAAAPNGSTDGAER